VSVGLPPYSSYRGSGVRWLGEIPGHWAIRRLRNVAEMRVSGIDKKTNDNERPVRLCNYVDVYKNDRITDKIFFMKATALPEEVERYRLVLGDVLITKDSETWNDIGVPSLVEYAASDLVSGYHLALLRARPAFLVGSYLHRSLQARPVIYQFHVAANGVTRYGLSHDAIKALVLPIPPIEEQKAIVRFLDHADRRIRRYVGGRKKMLALLDEQKQTLIEHAVTRGLDPTTSLRPSGVPWLGDVPEHWVVASLRFHYHQCLGKMVDTKKATGTSLLPYLRNVDVQWDRINAVNLPQIDITAAEHERYTVKAGDLLVCEGRHLGRAAFWRGELPICAFQKALHRLRPRDPGNDSSRYLFYCLYVVHFKDAFDASSDDNSIPHLTGEMLRAHKFPFPPLEEQESIARYLDGRIAALNRARAAVESEIECVRQYRIRLIADAVTGKLDVREAAARLPDHPDDADPTGIDHLAVEHEAGNLPESETVAEEAEA